MLNMLTVDVEDYYMVSGFENKIPFNQWPNYESRVVNNTRVILAILDEFRIKATFFVLGWVAEHYPSLVKEIFEKGHEIASHGYAHKLIYSQSPGEFREDIRKTKKILENIIHQPVNGYRAPCYSITKKTTWAFEIIAQEGYCYDSSVFPILHDRGGLPSASRFMHIIKINQNQIIEIPLTTFKIFKFNLPIAGGGYFRLFPYGLTRAILRRINDQNESFVIYLHPWEIDPGQPRIEVDPITKIRHYSNLSSMQSKLRALCNDFSFISIKESLRSAINIANDYQ